MVPACSPGVGELPLGRIKGCCIRRVARLAGVPTKMFRTAYDSAFTVLVNKEDPFQICWRKQSTGRRLRWHWGGQPGRCALPAGKTGERTGKRGQPLPSRCLPPSSMPPRRRRGRPKRPILEPSDSTTASDGGRPALVAASPPAATAAAVVDDALLPVRATPPTARCEMPAAGCCGARSRAAPADWQSRSSRRRGRVPADWRGIRRSGACTGASSPWRRDRV